MNKADRKLLFALIKRHNLESVVIELSAICNWQSIKTDIPAWRMAELSLERIAHNLPYAMRSIALVPDYELTGAFSQEMQSLHGTLERNKAILAMRAQGKTQQQVSDAFGISKARVWQIVKKFGAQ